MADSRPLIGITSYAETARWGVWEEAAALIPLTYVQAVNRAGGRPLIVPPKGRRWLSFANLVEAHTVAAFRASGVSMQKIRPALAYLVRQLQIEHPLASRTPSEVASRIQKCVRWISSSCTLESVIPRGRSTGWRRSPVIGVRAATC